MGLRTFFTDVLANLQFAQTANQPRPKDQREKHRGQAGVYRANRDVPKNVERAEVAPQHFDEEVVEHSSAGPPDANTLRGRRGGRSGHPQFVPSSLRANLSPATGRQE